ncbi:DUF305 domain-containing protein [uncultured Chryseobacterium sp.]|uniref:DUF305 domain-containing protein n=1 Tax=uncultured Chryseobacterium sp. TaxID=259322 RepID=UPI0025EAA29C|nr:DUF305 domain-containing protein [uncultured Chryseobacterium sp.]
MSYKKFFLMMLISWIIMYLMMFINMDSISHYHTSLTRIYMALLMIMPMAVLMIAMMGKMYPSQKINRTIVAASIILFSVVLMALQKQEPVTDVQYMKAMIPHHSSAIMTSKNAHLKDPEVRRLADSIIAAQKREIRQMEEMISRLEQSR